MNGRADHARPPARCRTARERAPAPWPGPDSACRASAGRRPRRRRWRAAPSRCDTATASRRSRRSACRRRQSGLDVAVRDAWPASPIPTVAGTKRSTSSPMRAGSDLVARREQRRTFGRRLERLGDHHRDRLVGVADAVVLQHLDAECKGLPLRLRIAARAAAGWPASSPRRRRDAPWRLRHRGW